MNKKIHSCTSTIAIALMLLVAGATITMASPASLTGEPIIKGEKPEPSKGPHGGQWLREGEISVELAIVEQGISPEYHAWISRNGQPVEDAELKLTLIRLDGESENYRFHKESTVWRAAGVIKEPHSFDVVVSLTLNGKHYRWAWSSYETRVDIPADMAKRAGIRTTSASAGNIERHLQVYGKLETPPAGQAQVQGRFPGIVRAIQVDVGDPVKRGDVLAIIESNESLKTYPLTSPIDGIIQARSANVGELSGSTPLFTVINTQKMWAALHVFPGQRFGVKSGLSVHVSHNEHLHESSIERITPAQDGEPYVLARVTLNNSTGDMAPGDLVSAQIDAEKVTVPLVVKNEALQSLRGWQVVFIRVGDIYEARPLELGRRDNNHSEVLSGLKLGDEYVVENSYLIKADIEKSGASHDH